MQGKQYPNPPIEEALVELRFDPGPEWDWTVPGMLRAKLPIYSNSHSTQQHLTVGVRGAGFVGGTGITRVHLATEDKAQLLGIGPDLISVHRLRPYDGWNNLRPRVEEALQTYSDLQSPKGVARVGLRYVNKFAFHGSPSGLVKYVRTSLPVPERNESGVERVITNAHVTLASGAFVAITVAAARLDADKTELTLDFDLTLDCSGAEPLSLDEVMSRIDGLRTEERLAFEDMITDDARALFV